MTTQVHVKHFKGLNSPDIAQPNGVYFVFGENHVGILVSDEDGNLKPVVVDIDVLTGLVDEALEGVHLGGTWGQILGTLSAQTDLVNALAAKAPINYGINAQTGTTYALQASDNGKVITFSNACKVSVPTGLGAGFNCRLVQVGTGQVTVEAAGTTINNRQQHNKLAGRYAVATLAAYASNTFVFSGDTTKVSLLLDLITAVPNRAYSFRRLTGSYSGYCAAVRPAGSSGAWTDIGFDANDWLDVNAAIAVGSDLEILRYDQSGNGLHEQQIEGFSLPRLELNALNGKPVRKISQFQAARIGDLSAFTSGEAHFLLRKANDPPINSNNGFIWRTGTSGNNTHLTAGNGAIYCDFGSTTWKTNIALTPSAANWGLYSVYSATDDWQCFYNSQSLHTDDENTVGFNSNSIFHADETMYDGEFILFDEKLSNADRQIIWNNIEASYFLNF